MADGKYCDLRLQLVKRQLGHGQLYIHRKYWISSMREDMFESLYGKLMLLLLRLFVRVVHGHTSVSQCASCGEGANSLRTFLRLVNIRIRVHVRCTSSGHRGNMVYIRCIARCTLTRLIG